VRQALVQADGLHTYILEFEQDRCALSLVGVICIVKGFTDGTAGHINIVACTGMSRVSQSTRYLYGEMLLTKGILKANALVAHYSEVGECR
jgi:hypothetical protein